MAKNFANMVVKFITFDIYFYILYNSLALTYCEILSINLEILSLTKKVKL